MKGLLCTGQVVKNILDGSQTQHRTPMKVQPEIIKHADEGSHIEWGKYQFDFISDLLPYAPSKVGDILYVRETLMLRRELPERKYFDALYSTDRKHFESGSSIEHIDQTEWFMQYKQWWNQGKDKVVIPNIHMPKWAARIFLEVTGVRCERVQDISLEDIRAEGLGFAPDCDGSIMRTEWKNLWNTLYPGSWERNDWVWVRTFKQIDKPKGGE